MSLVLLPRLGFVKKLIKANNSIFYTQSVDFPGFEDAVSSPIQAIPMAFSSYERRPSKGGSKKSTATPILIMHELFSSKDHWAEWSEELYNITKRKVVVFNARNHGDSPHVLQMTIPHIAEDIRASIMQMDVERASLIGHRMGARAMMFLALLYPKLVKDLIVVDVVPGSADSHMSEIPRYLEAMHRVRLRPNLTYADAVKSINLQLIRSIPNRALRQLLLSNVVQLRNVEYKWGVNLVAIALNYPDIVMPLAIREPRVFDRPTLFVAGEKTPPISKALRIHVRKTFKKAEFMRIPDIANQVDLKKSVKFLKCVLDFLARSK